MRRPSFVFYVLFLGLNYVFGTLWYLILTAAVAVGLAVAIKRYPKNLNIIPMLILRIDSFFGNI